MDLRCARYTIYIALSPFLPVLTFDRPPRKKLNLLTRIQTNTLEDMLLRPTGIRLEPLTDMLEDMFDNSEQFYQAQTSMSMIEELADRLYAKNINIQSAMHEFQSLTSGVQINSDSSRLQTQGVLALALNDLVKLARKSCGRAELKEIQGKFEQTFKSAKKQRVE